jgi:5-methylcytosine-specific restriction enzyme subunit McrC
MLQTVHELPRLAGSAGQELEQAPLIDALASIFFDELLRLVKAGLHRTYASECDNLQTIKGRLLIGEHVARNSGRMDRALCEFDELTADVGPNRVLALALKTMRPWLSQSDSQRRWAELMAAFEGVGQASPHEVKGICLTRQTSRYRDALRFAQWIIDMMSPALRGGSEVAPAMLFDMNVLFESYVAACLARQAPPGVEVLPQHNAMHLDRTSGKIAYRLKPDIVVTRGREVLVVADTKWKVLEEDTFGRIRPTSADMYQMNAYGSAYRCQEMALIYPSFPGLNTQLMQHPTNYVLSAGAGTVSLHITGVELLEDRLRVGAGSVGSALEKLLRHVGQGSDR